MNPLSVNFGCQIQTLDGSGREQNHIFSSSVDKSGPELRGYIAPKHKQIFFCLRSQCPQPIVDQWMKVDAFALAVVGVTQIFAALKDV